MHRRHINAWKIEMISFLFFFSYIEMQMQVHESKQTSHNTRCTTLRRRSLYMGQHTCKTRKNLPKCRKHYSRALVSTYGATNMPHKTSMPKHTQLKIQRKHDRQAMLCSLFLGSSPSHAHYRHTPMIGFHHNNHERHA